MKIRLATTNDLPYLLDIYNITRKHMQCFDSKAINLNTFKNITDGETIFTAKENDKILGFLSLWESEKFIHLLYVSPNHQRQGVATKLIEHCLSQCGYPLLLKCLEDNKEACKFMSIMVGELKVMASIMMAHSICMFSHN